MKKNVHSATYVLIGLCLALLPLSCKTTDSDMHVVTLDEETLEGYTVVSLSIDEDDTVELTSSETRGFKVTVTLNKAVPSGTTVEVPFLVRDVELIQGDPLAASVIGVGAGKTSATVADRFYMYCNEDGDVAGKTASPGDLFGNLEKYDRSSNESNTQIFIQYGEELQTIFGITVGVKDAVESNRVRVKCK